MRTISRRPLSTLYSRAFNCLSGLVKIGDCTGLGVCCDIGVIAVGDLGMPYQVLKEPASLKGGPPANSEGVGDTACESASETALP